MKASLKNFKILLLIVLPAFITGGLLSFAGNLTDGLRLGFLSLPGVVFTYLAITRHKNYWYILPILWWLVSWLDALLRSSTWFLFNSDNEAYFIIEAVANTNKQEILEFFQLHLALLAAVLLSPVVLLGIYSYAVCKLVRPLHFSQLWNSLLS